jgi:YHS domain-containing protein
VTFTYKDQVIGFCCKDCCGKFAKEPEKYIAKVKEFKAPEKK